MGTRAALAALVVAFGWTAIGCSTETEKLPELPKAPAPEPAPPVADTRPKSVPLGEPTRQTQSAIGGAYRSSLARIEDIQITHQLNLYQAEHGHYPRSNEEFHEKFMKGYKIPYPQMEEGYELVYDPEDHAVYQKLIDRDGKLVGAMLVGCADAAPTLAQLFDRAETLPPNRLDVLATTSGVAMAASSDAEICNCHHVKESVLVETAADPI